MDLRPQTPFCSNFVHESLLLKTPILYFCGEKVHNPPLSSQMCNSTLNHTTNQWNPFEIEAGKDSIVGDWFTVIRDKKGEYLRVILSENLGDIRTLYIGTDNSLMGCEISQLGK